jgi:hypothetical protein
MTTIEMDEARKPENVKKYQTGFDDGNAGFPMNRFMKTDQHYIRGYEAGKYLAESY